MRKIQIFLLVLLVSVVQIYSLFGQQGPRSDKRKRIALIAKKPTVYIEFVRNQCGIAARRTNGDKCHLLKLRNNSIWGIRLLMSGGTDNRSDEARLYYDVISPDESVMDMKRCHVCSSNIIPSGKSIEFYVPVGTVTSERLIRLNFSFDWEDEIRIAPAEEPKHYVFFDHLDLP